jgi:hypothetical protein
MRYKLVREISYGRVSTSDPDSDPEFTSGPLLGSVKSPKKSRTGRSAVGPTRRAKRTRRAEDIDNVRPSEQRKMTFHQTYADIALQKQRNAVKARHRTHF